MQDFATRSLTISEETPEVAMELLTEDTEVFILFGNWVHKVVTRLQCCNAVVIRLIFCLYYILIYAFT